MLLLGMADLRDNEQFLLDYPGACTISTKQVNTWSYFIFLSNLVFVSASPHLTFTQCRFSHWAVIECITFSLPFQVFMERKCTKISLFQGEELKKLIGAVAYIECSSKTQQVSDYYLLMKKHKH